MKRWAALASVAAVMVLAGCGDEGTWPETKSVRAHEVDLADGRTITCIVYEDGQGGGIDCDWGGGQ